MASDQFYIKKINKTRKRLSHSQLLTYKVSKLNLDMPKLSLVSYLGGLLEENYTLQKIHLLYNYNRLII